MSEPKGPFDRAIISLKNSKSEARDNGDHVEEISYRRAIRVLEAAGKVLQVTDNSVLTLDTFWEVFVKATDKKTNKKGGAYRIRYEAIRALLESLPGKED